MTTTEPMSSSEADPLTDRVIPVRRVAFDYPRDELPRHYVGGDLVMSHVVTVLSSMFPDGEDYFVRSVRRFRNRITDDELRTRVAGFIGQEAMHGRQHREFNTRLGELGYPTRSIERTIDRLLRFRERFTPALVNLAVTAALEHYTATLAEVLMTDVEAREALAVDEVRSLMLWHALEESEHKAVAFDVYQHVSGNHFIRALVMNVVTIGFLIAVVLGTTWSLLHDRATRNPLRLLRSLAALRRSPFLRREVIRHLRDYNRRGFHPDDHDTTDLVAQWQAELFGTKGVLAGKLAS